VTAETGDDSVQLLRVFLVHHHVHHHVPAVQADIARDVETAHVRAEHQTTLPPVREAVHEFAVMFLDVEMLWPPGEHEGAVEQHRGKNEMMLKHLAPGRRPAKHATEVLARSTHTRRGEQHEVQTHGIEQCAADTPPEGEGDPGDQLHGEHRAAFALCSPMPAHRIGLCRVSACFIGNGSTHQLLATGHDLEG
jgi:hypothetical protein